MKKFKYLVISVAVVALFATLPGCSAGRAAIGDKTLSQLAESQAIFNKQIVDYKNTIVGLQQQNNHLAAEASDSATILINKQKIADNNVLITHYQAMVADLEGAVNNFIVTAAGKDELNNVSLYSNDPLEIAKAYMYIKYADGLYAPANADATSVSSLPKTALIGVVENRGYLSSVVAVVKGPLGFYRNFTLNAGQESPPFVLPVPGKYTTVFTRRNECRIFESEVGPNIVYYDAKGQRYDYKATLLP